MTAAVAQSSKQNTGRIQLIVSGLCWLAIFFDGFDTFVYGTVVPPLLRDQQWHLTPAQAGVSSGATRRWACSSAHLSQAS